jgi:hypothetical protein
MMSQLVAIAKMQIRSVINSIRHRQGAGAAVVMPVLVVFLTVELARFGARSATGMQRVLAVVTHARAVHYGSFWMLVLCTALTAMKYARVVPGRGSRKLFDLMLVRALPVSAVARLIAETLAAMTYGTGLVGLVMVPTLWGMSRHTHGVVSSLVFTTVIALCTNTVTAMVAVALHEGWSRQLSGRGTDAARVMAAVVHRRWTVGSWTRTYIAYGTGCSTVVCVVADATTCALGTGRIAT